MYTEIEAKLKVESHKEVIKRLAELGAGFLAEQFETDYYFDDANRTFTKSDRCLRVRRLLIEEAEKIFLTYKGAREKSEFKKRPEIEIEIADADSAEKLLSALGYEKVLVFEKKRRVWQLGECEVALDQLPLLGCFVEIEGPSDGEIANVQRDLGLANLRHIEKSYATLMEEELHQLGREERELFL